MKIVHKSDTGRLRDKDEDSVVTLRMDFAYGSLGKERTLLVLGDGIGGAPSGEVASFLATKMLSEYMLPTLLSWAERIDYLPLLAEGFKDTNRRVLEYAVRNPQHAGMGTTLTAAVLEGRVLSAANVGDSRLYIINKKSMTQVSVDHRDASGALTRAVGSFPEIEADVFRRELKPKDRILVCCDGLTDQVSKEEIAEIMRSGKSIEAACDVLIDSANEAGGADNVSLIIAEVA